LFRRAFGFIAAVEDGREDDDEYGENYLQKFDEFTKKNILETYHPELQQHNHDEIEAMSVIVRDKNGNIADPLHRTLPFLTKYERARILGERAKQLDAGAKALVEVESGVIDGYLIAMAELEQKKIPFIIKRPMLNGGCEYWKLKDLEFL
jgi:DNA-directed RNA polymerase I, II, and III subunit RPABC2